VQFRFDVFVAAKSVETRILTNASPKHPRLGVLYHANSKRLNYGGVVAATAEIDPDHDGDRDEALLDQ
jgi:hypothetical protein